jgi:hypothetical protein
MIKAEFVSESSAGLPELKGVSGIRGCEPSVV